MIPDPKLKSDKKKGQNNYDTDSDTNKHTETGADALLKSSPTDANADEKVITNSSQDARIVNSPSQTAANINKEAGSDEPNL